MLGGDDAAARHQPAHWPRPAGSSARWRERVVVYERVAPEPTASTVPLAARPEGTGVNSGPRAWTWAALMHWAFAIDVLACPHCGGRLRLIATLHNPAVIRNILAHWGSPLQVRAQAPPRAQRDCALI